jgi:hypothetical protein
MTTSRLDAALRHLAAAEAEVAEAEARAAFEKTFSEVGEVFLVMARTAEFHQFVSYAEVGIPVGVFTDREAADTYVAGTPAPTGTFLLVEPMPLQAHRGA